MISFLTKKRSDDGRWAAKVRRLYRPRIDQWRRVRGLTKEKRLNIGFDRGRQENENIRLALQLIQQALTEIAIKNDVVDVVVMFVLTGGADMVITGQRRVNAQDNASAIIIMHMMQMNVRIELADSRYLKQQEAGEPPVAPQYANDL
ncbi:MAG: hypothetical protein NDJ18_04310 [candidate division Zixibacteria bacterium]|nr:hypothetical protein [candidate division Zixibacteria bacterium]